MMDQDGYLDYRMSYLLERKKYFEVANDGGIFVFGLHRDLIH